MTVRDNGMGFEWNSSAYDSLGFEMISALVEQLHGSMSVESGASGSRITVRFPAV